MYVHYVVNYTDELMLCFTVNTWMFSFVAECVSEVAAKTLTAVIPPYSVILALDAKIRDFSIPVFPEVIPLDPSQPAMVMARYAMSHCRETSKCIQVNIWKPFSLFGQSFFIFIEDFSPKQ